jgi:hypothetical protein
MVMLKTSWIVLALWIMLLYTLRYKVALRFRVSGVSMQSYCRRSTEGQQVSWAGGFMSGEGRQQSERQGPVPGHDQHGEPDQRSERDIASYLADIRDIKNLLSVNQEKPIVSPWAFHSWGILVLLGTLANLVGYHYAGLGFDQSLWWIWVPVMILGGLLESVGFIQVYRRQALVLSSPRVMKTYLGLWGLFVSASVILIHLIRMQAIEPGLILVMLALFFMVFALASYQRVLGPAYVLLGLGIIFLVFGFSGSWSYAAAGLVCSLAFFAGGFICKSAKPAP